MVLSDEVKGEAMGGKRDAYVEKLKVKLDEWNQEIDKLQVKAGQVQADARVELQKRVEELKAKRGDLKGRLDEMSRSGEAAFEDLKAGADMAWKAMSEAVRSAATRFKK